MSIEKIGKSKDVWVTCPQCKRVFYVERLFWEPQFEKLKFHCPFCSLDFAREESPSLRGM
ncbi:MAG: hypothetical protein ACE5PO_07270 [Candidatus Bathyarchaeia archaeon]